VILGCDFEDHSEIYTDGYAALRFAQMIPEKINNYKTAIHFIWCVNKKGRPFERKQSLALKSAIVTQNLDTTEIYLWSNIDLKENEDVKELLPHINFRIYDPFELSIDTPLEGFNEKLKRDDDNFFLGGDLARLLILYKYGGVYCDCDIVLLRDLSPLLDNEFMYQWGTELDKINGAIMRMFAGSDLATQCLEWILRIQGGQLSTHWGSELYSFVRQSNKDWTIFPCAFFNTEWQVGINMAESGHPFKKSADSNKLFEGAFAWHWHNKWDAEIEEGSKFSILEHDINNKMIKFI